MMDVNTQIEKIKIKGVNIFDLLNPKFKDKLKDKELEAFPIALVFALPNNKSGAVVLSHQNLIEIENREIHLECASQETIKKFESILKESGG